MKPICYGHCFLEFPDQATFSEHCTKVAKQRERRNKLNLFKKLQKELTNSSSKER